MRQAHKFWSIAPFVRGCRSLSPPSPVFTLLCFAEKITRRCRESFCDALWLVAQGQKNPGRWAPVMQLLAYWQPPGRKTPVEPILGGRIYRFFRRIDKRGWQATAKDQEAAHWRSRCAQCWDSELLNAISTLCSFIPRLLEAIISLGSCRAFRRSFPAAERSGRVGYWVLDSIV